MDKRYQYHRWMRLRAVKPWYLLVAAVVSGSVAVWALRSNNFHMAALRSAVFIADKNDRNVTQALQNLQMYVTTHMNTELSTGPNAPYPPIQLAYTYDRAVRAVSDQATASNSQLYTDAQKYCEQQDSIDYYGTNRVPCVQNYVRTHSVEQAPNIPDSLYKFDFASPWWSPDLAGWSMLFTILLLLAALVLALTRWWAKRTSR